MKKKTEKIWSPDSYIKSYLRKIWRWSPTRKDCLKASSCASCKKRSSDLYADHIDPVVNPNTGFIDWNTYIDRMFNGKLQALCEGCHAAKTKEEGTLRRKMKKARETNG